MTKNNKKRFPGLYSTKYSFLGIWVFNFYANGTIEVFVIKIKFIKTLNQKLITFFFATENCQKQSQSSEISIKKNGL